MRSTASSASRGSARRQQPARPLHLRLGRAVGGEANRAASISFSEARRADAGPRVEKTPDERRPRRSSTETAKARAPFPRPSRAPATMSRSRPRRESSRRRRGRRGRGAAARGLVIERAAPGAPLGIGHRPAARPGRSRLLDADGCGVSERGEGRRSVRRGRTRPPLDVAREAEEGVSRGVVAAVELARVDRSRRRRGLPSSRSRGCR